MLDSINNNIFDRSNCPILNILHPKLYDELRYYYNIFKLNLK